MPEEFDLSQRSLAEHVMFKRVDSLDSDWRTGRQVNCGPILHQLV